MAESKSSHLVVVVVLVVAVGLVSATAAGVTSVAAEELMAAQRVS